MIGWNRIQSRDYEELIVNGLVDEDLDRMREAIEHRKDFLESGNSRCPICGERIVDAHVHDGLMIRRIDTE